MLFITITGIDKSGKSTLIKAFHEATDYEHYVVDRSPDTFWFFNVIRDRVKNPNQICKYFELNDKLKNVLDLAILISAEPEDLEKRFIEHLEPPLVGEYSFKDHIILLEDYFDRAKYKNVLKINTSKHSIKECVETIKDKIKCL